MHIHSHCPQDLTWVILGDGVGITDGVDVVGNGVGIAVGPGVAVGSSVGGCLGWVACDVWV